MAWSACPNCGADIDDNSYDFKIPKLDVDVDIEDTDKGPRLTIDGDDKVSAEIWISCMHCWWWVHIATTIDVSVNDKVDANIDARIKPLTQGPFYDDATELWDYQGAL